MRITSVKKYAVQLAVLMAVIVAAFILAPTLSSLLGDPSVVGGAVYIRESIRAKAVGITIVRVVLFCLVIFIMWGKLCAYLARGDKRFEEALSLRKNHFLSLYLFIEALSLMTYVDM